MVSMSLAETLNHPRFGCNLSQRPNYNKPYNLDVVIYSS